MILDFDLNIIKEKIPFVEIKNRMNGIQPEMISKKSMKKILKLKKKEKKTSKNVEFVEDWMNYLVEYKIQKGLANEIKEKIPELNSKIQVIMQNINKLTKEKEKNIKNAKDITRYLEKNETYTTNCTEISSHLEKKSHNNKNKQNSSHIGVSSSITKRKNSLNNLQIHANDLGYKDHIDNKETDITSIIYEENTNLTGFSFKFCCF